MATNQTVKIGSRIKIKTTSYVSYDAPKGSIHEVIAIPSHGTVQISTAYGPVNIAKGHYEPATLTKEQLQKELETAKSLVKDLESKVKWMNETKSEEYDEDEWKVWQVLSTLDSKATKMEKVKAIAVLIKS